MTADIAHVGIDELTPHPRNPRQSNIDAIASSIAANGWVGAVVAQRSTGYVLAGSHRLQAARRQGITEVPCHWVDCDDETALRIMLADNRTADLAGYDADQLVALLRDAGATAAGMAGSGFDEGVLARMVGRAAGATADADAVDGSWQVAEGDRFAAAGNACHTVVCADSDTVASPPVDAVVTDPPYELDASAVRATVGRFADRAAVLTGSGQALTLVGDGWRYCLDLVWRYRRPRGLPRPHTPLLQHALVIYMAYGVTPMGWQRPDPDFSSVIELNADTTEFPAESGHAKAAALFAEIVRGVDAGSWADPYLGTGGTLLGCDSLGLPLFGAEADPEVLSACLGRLEAAGLTVSRQPSGPPSD